MRLCTIIDQDAKEAERVCSLERTLELRKLMLQRMEPKFELILGQAVFYLSPTVFFSASSDSEYFYGRVCYLSGIHHISA